MGGLPQDTTAREERDASTSPGSGDRAGDSDDRERRPRLSDQDLHQARADGYDDWTWTDTHVASFAGGATGVGYMFTRIGVGFFDVLTFPWPTKPVMQPPTPVVYLEGVVD
jgi:hypothetical protein